MIEIYQLVIIFILSIVIIVYWCKKKLYKLKYKIKTLNGNIDYYEREADIFKEKNISLEKNLLEITIFLEKVKNEEAEVIEILKLNRLNNNTKITDRELKYFANNLGNGIELGQCDKNAYIVKEEFGGKINLGKATVIKNGESPRVTDGHLWNIAEYFDNGIKKEQLIDILNYKDNQEVRYTNHDGRDLTSTEKKHFNKRLNIK